MDLHIHFVDCHHVEELVGVVFQLVTRGDVVCEGGAGELDVFGGEASVLGRWV